MISMVVRTMNRKLTWGHKKIGLSVISSWFQFRRKLFRGKGAILRNNWQVRVALWSMRGGLIQSVAVSLMIKDRLLIKPRYKQQAIAWYNFHIKISERIQKIITITIVQNHQNREKTKWNNNNKFWNRFKNTGKALRKTHFSDCIYLSHISVYTNNAIKSHLYF